MRNNLCARSKEIDMSVHNGTECTCPRCGSAEYLKNEDSKINRYCGNCGQRLNWTVSRKAEEAAEVADNAVKDLLNGGWA